MEIHCTYTDLVDPVSLVSNPRNPNRHPDRQVELLARVIEHQGWRVPITVSNRSGFVVRGHGRLLAALRLGLEKVPVDRQDYASEADEWADLVADNRIAELAEMDGDILKDLLQELDAGGFDMDLTGFDEGELDRLLAAPPGEVRDDNFDAAAASESITEPVTRPGDIWLLGRHRLMCGDSTQAVDVQRLMDGKLADLCLTDPPYCVDYENIQRRPDCPTRKDMGDVYDDPNDPAQLLTFIQLAPSDVLVMTFPVNKHFHELSDATREWDLLYDCVWVKNHFAFIIGRRYQVRHEPILIFRRRKHRSGGAWNIPPNQSTVFEYDKPSANKEHPTIKPLDLWAELLRFHSDEGHLVLDPFLGSGTTLIAAEQLNRSCYGMEIQPRYCDVIVRRWEQFTGKKAELIKE